jgi:hypothetical protein
VRSMDGSRILFCPICGYKKGLSADMPPSHRRYSLLPTLQNKGEQARVATSGLAIAQGAVSMTKCNIFSQKCCTWFLSAPLLSPARGRCWRLASEPLTASTAVSTNGQSQEAITLSMRMPSLSAEKVAWWQIDMLGPLQLHTLSVILQYSKTSWGNGLSCSNFLAMTE